MRDSTTLDAWFLLVVVPLGRADRDRIFDFSDRIPDANWFWRSLGDHHGKTFTGIDQYEFTHKAVRWACGDKMKEPDTSYTGRRPWRDELPCQADASKLALELRRLASYLSESDAIAAAASPFWEPATPASWGDLLVQLAEWLELPLPPTS